MAPVGILWSHDRQCQKKVILSVAALNALELEQPKWSFMKKPPDFTAKFPYNKIPAFESKDGFKLTESTAISRYLCSIGTKINLLGSNAKEAAIVDQWIHFAEMEIGTPTHNINGMIDGYCGSFNLEIIDKNAERLVRALAYLESYLSTRPCGYVALDTLTLADFVLASMIFGAARVALGHAERAQYPYIFAYYAKVTEDERVKKYWGTNEFVDVRITRPKL